MSKRRFSAAQREAGRVTQMLAGNKRKAARRGVVLTHGLVDTYDDYGCRCTVCRIAKAKDTGRAVDPHWHPDHNIGSP